MNATDTQLPADQLADDVVDVVEDEPTPVGMRAQAAPWLAMSLLVMAAGAARIAMNATGEDADVASGIAATAFVVAVVAAYTHRRRRPMSRQLRLRLRAAWLLSAAWLSAVTYNGMSTSALAALTIVGTGLSLLYWREHRPKLNLVEPALLLSTMPTPDDNDLYITRWKNNLGRPNGTFAGSTLEDPEIIRAGYRYTLRLVPGVQTVAAVAKEVETLRSGLQLMPGQSVIVEEHPDLPAPTAILTVVTKPQVREPRGWPGPERSFDSASGAVNLGPFIDGEGMAQFTVYRNQGMFGGYIQGGPGSGKSRTIESICMALAASRTHPTVIWYGDGQHGDSSPLLVEHADYSAVTFDAIYNMLACALLVMRINGAINRQNKQSGFTPTQERAGLFVVLDECHKVFDANQNPHAAACQNMALTIAREGRKVGVALLMASQSPTLDAFGGALTSQNNGADTLRASLLSGNGLLLASKTGNAKQVFKVDIDPTSFPDLPGYGYLCNPRAGERSAPYRGFWVTDEMAGIWPHRIKWRSLSPVQANVAGERYARRHEEAEEQMAADMELIAMAQAGLLDVDAINRASQGTPASAPSSTVVAGAAGDESLVVNRVPMPWLTPMATPAASPAADTSRAGRTVALKDGQRLVLEAIRTGNNSPKRITMVTGYSASQVHNLLNELVDLGLIHNSRFGHYDLLVAA
ncbi:hypothetical protein [Catellatospora sp. NPDC049133]|uniref:hypothetical protein n=1 Tax=Catellatospora sp. NPDC049133 TaxID=3155499 RepID=UPI003406EE00